MFILQKSNKKVSSRRQISIKGVRDGILMLPDNQYRQIIKAESINFELKSDAEQDNLIESYQFFLNSLNTPIQIVSRIREMDLDKYINSFAVRLNPEKENIYRKQISNYIDFLKSLVNKNKLLTRSFYVIVPYSSKIEPDFSVVKERLALAVDIAVKGLSRLGIESHPLSSLETLDLFYSFYNPESSKRQPISEITLELINKAYL